MSNHYHLVVKLNNQETEQWSNDEVIHRWLSLFKGPLLIQKYIKGDKFCSEENYLLEKLVEKWRDRLGDLSWFMKQLNEPIAKQANKEDHCSGHFWGRFFAPAKPAFPTSM